METTPNQTSSSFQSTENSVTETPQDRFEANALTQEASLTFFKSTQKNSKQIFQSVRKSSGFSTFEPRG